MKIKLFIAALSCLVGLSGVFAQSADFRVVHGFTGPDGAYPGGSVVLSGNTLYGAAEFGATPGNGYGTVFAVNVDGSGYTNLYKFYNATNGAYPGGLILSGTNLYGNAYQGGAAGVGSLFKMDTNGNNVTLLYSFGNGSNGASPQANLVLSGSTLFGATGQGSSGTDMNGTIFRINTDGSSFTNLHTFSFSGLQSSSTNSDGANPAAGLVLSGNVLYGTTENGGFFGDGTIFRINTDGSGFTNLYNFTALNPDASTNSDGANPAGTLLLIGNVLYGTASTGGAQGLGTVFSITTDGLDFTNLHDFNGINDEANPVAGLVANDGTLYGTTQFAGTEGNGAVFSLNTDGSNFTNLYSFSSLNGVINSDGAQPLGALIFANDTLYGTASEGGNAGNGGQGTVFAISSFSTATAPFLSIASMNGHAVISWPLSAAGYSLQSTTNLALNAWTTITTGISSNASNYSYTNLLTAQTAFFRLRSQ
jgi:uncharacterized repeat protein (TIGR03803 family)